MDLACYLHPGWKPLIRPAAPTRDWMTNSPESFAYRCLPLNIANSHGWEILSPCAFDACWTGSTGADGVLIRLADKTPPELAPVSIFGQGVLTFHIAGLFRTSPEWNLWIGGSPNYLKDSIQALTAIVETDWAPFTFTMNWRFTRPNTWVHFDAEEPICFFFPVQRGYLEEIAPKFRAMENDPDLLKAFQDWSTMRQAFQSEVAKQPPANPADKWQKHYYRGTDASGCTHVGDHQVKLRLQPFSSEK